VLILNYLAYLVFIRSRGVVDWRQMFADAMCDWGMVVVMVAMWTGNQRCLRLRISGGLAARCKPSLRRTCLMVSRTGDSSVFFTSHCGIIVGVVFLMLTRGYRPLPTSIVRVWLWSEFYFVVTLAVDILTGVNYGFSCINLRHFRF